MVCRSPVPKPFWNIAPSTLSTKSRRVGCFLLRWSAMRLRPNSNLLIPTKKPGSQRNWCYTKKQLTTAFIMITLTMSQPMSSTGTTAISSITRSKSPRRNRSYHEQDFVWRESAELRSALQYRKHRQRRQISRRIWIRRHLGSRSRGLEHRDAPPSHLLRCLRSDYRFTGG